MLGGPFSFPEETRMDWLKSKSLETNAYFIIKKDMEPVGEVSFRDLENETAYLNIKVTAKYRGQQIARKALDLFLDFFQNECKGRVIFDEVRRENVAGISFLLKYGFKIIEEKERTLLLKWPDNTEKERCVCCNSLTIDVRGEFEICPVCFWEDDGYFALKNGEIYSYYQNISSIEGLLNIPSGANNGLTLLEARKNFQAFGACELSMKKHVRAPKPNEL